MRALVQIDEGYCRGRRKYYRSRRMARDFQDPNESSLRQAQLLENRVQVTMAKTVYTVLVAQAEQIMGINY